MSDNTELASQGGTQHPRRKMASLRLNTAEDPDKQDRITRKLKERGSSISIYGRELFDALERFIDKHDKLPKLPLRIEGDGASPEK